MTQFIASKIGLFLARTTFKGEKSLDTGEREKKTTTFKGSQGATATHIPLLRTMGQYPFLKEHFNFHCQNFHEIFMYLKKIPKNFVKMTMDRNTNAPSERISTHLIL